MPDPLWGVRWANELRARRAIRRRSGTTDPIQNQFEVEHGPEPHCFVCRQRIDPGELVELRRISADVIVWRHQECREGED